jgi:hypothetical protein
MDELIRNIRANARPAGNAATLVPPPLPTATATPASKSQKPNASRKTTAGIVLFGLFAIWAFMHDQSPPPAASALDKMAAVFKGNYSRDQIDDLLSRVMQMYGSPLTEAQYQRWGNVLVTMRENSHPVSEMEILTCMRAMGPVMEFTAAAATCATAGQLGL